jgi:hypothetical protein
MAYASGASGLPLIGDTMLIAELGIPNSNASIFLRCAARPARSR